MASQLLAIEIDVRDVICRAKVNEETRVFFLLIFEGFLVPDSTFVKQQTVLLSVPIPRHVQGCGGVEVIFDQITLSLRPGIFEIAVGAGLIAIVKVAGFIRIDNRLPFAIKADSFSAIRIGN